MGTRDFLSNESLPGYLVAIIKMTLGLECKSVIIIPNVKKNMLRFFGSDAYVLKWIKYSRNIFLYCISRWNFTIKTMVQSVFRYLHSEDVWSQMGTYQKSSQKKIAHRTCGTHNKEMYSFAIIATRLESFRIIRITKRATLTMKQNIVSFFPYFDLFYIVVPNRHFDRYLFIFALQKLWRWKCPFQTNLPLRSFMWRLRRCVVK